jgi:hypothetical protein
MYQGERGLAARPNGRARKAISASDTNSGSKITTARPAVACTFIESDATSRKQRSRASLRAVGCSDQCRIGSADIMALGYAAAGVTEQLGDRRIAVALVGGKAPESPSQIV